jgi:hypothetical protein
MLGLGLDIVAFVGRAVVANVVTLVATASTTARKTSIPFPVVALASAAVNPDKAAIGIRTSLAVPS